MQSRFCKKMRGTYTLTPPKSKVEGTLPYIVKYCWLDLRNSIVNAE